MGHSIKRRSFRVLCCQLV